MLRMYDIDDARRRARISNLEARLALEEIDAALLSREISSSCTSARRRAEVIRRRDFALIKAAQIKKQLDEMRRLFPDLVQV